ncbi:unnamed protein product [Parnassius mnemosyne]|uniref:Reverse transcriptase/retrotransposon-derived protein RNase H-like domain-containing protein n=1 Tax=Parnassius mnemosyne TaxID=213953 RepID=A0AAV1M384_9NEOP
MEQVTAVLAQMMETIRGMQTQQANLQRALLEQDRKVDPVVGREWLRDLKLQFNLNSIYIEYKEESDITEQEFGVKLQNLLEEYQELFTEEIGKINNFQASFKLKDGVVPIFLKPRSVPFALRNQVEAEIDRLEKADIRMKKSHTYNGVHLSSPLLNKMARIEEIFSKLSGGKYFCTLDINQAYLHMLTSDETAEMQAISTCKGTYKVKRLMFGVKFIPNLASKLNPLYNLLPKDKEFIWSKECEKIFQELKDEICGEKVLIPFHENLPVTLATDASPTGFRAVLSHIMPDKTERPIAFTSKSLTKAEKGYSQLDKEAAALIWGLKKFFQYCYGRKITLVIDNKPLSRILHPEKATPVTTAIRLVHYANFLAGFDYDIKLRKTTEHANADYFSRLNKSTETENDNLTDDDAFYLNQISEMPVTLQEIREATRKDPDLQKLYMDIQSGRSDPKRLHEYSLQSNCIF